MSEVITTRNRRVDGPLRVHAEVEHVDERLHLALRMVVESDAGQQELRLVAPQHRPGQDRVPRPPASPASATNRSARHDDLLEKSQGRVDGGSYGKEATVGGLPISKGLAGVSMRLEAGVMQEHHWHVTAAEWADAMSERTRADDGGRSP